MRLSEFDLDVIHRAGVKHQAVDRLFRLPTTGEDHIVLKDSLPILSIEAVHSNSFDPIKQNVSQDDYILYEATHNSPDNASPSKEKIVAGQVIGLYCRAASL